ncbi:hypothetical protein LAV72_22535 [Lysinibacillus xylanilyticus]|uniref:hypothetical protein n=1 Tax=Lysinibacillus xylanilyticus TaxID=582475 RepID=UPI002B245AA6|nr:hypothetical protein [Lysinibacillus xylanilyticus]MEB2302386.1 hypothetical protein [Lysinibacillus xylanilyticus]
MYTRYIRTALLSMMVFVLVFPVQYLEVQAQNIVEVETRTNAVLEVDGKNLEI